MTNKYLARLSIPEITKTNKKIIVSWLKDVAKELNRENDNYAKPCRFNLMK